MKRFLSIAVSLCLLLSSLYGVLIVPASATDTSVSAKPANWVFKGDAYNDFEDTSVTQVYSGCGSIVADAEQGKVYQYNSTSGSETGNFLLNPTGTGSLVDAGYEAGDTLKLSYKGKSTGSANIWYALHINASQTGMWQQNINIGSGYIAYKDDKTWTKKTVTVTLPDTYDSTKHSSLFIQTTSTNTSALMDDIIIYRTTAITMEGDTDAVVWGADSFEYASADATYDPTNARVGDWYSFTLALTEGTSATVSYGDKEITPDGNGVYTFKVVKGNTLQVAVAETKPENWEYKGIIYNDFEDTSITQVRSGKSTVTTVDGNTVVEFNAGETSSTGAIAVNPTGLSSFDALGLEDGDTYRISVMSETLNDTDVWFQVRLTEAQGSVTWNSNDIQVGSATIWDTKWYGQSVKATGTSDLDMVYNSTTYSGRKGLYILFSSKGNAYIDDIIVYPTTNITLTGDSEYIEWQNDPFKYLTGTQSYDPTSARVGDWYSFTVSSAVNATVTYGGKTILPDENGVYNIKVEKGKALNVTKQSDVKLQTDLDEDNTANTVKVLAIGNSFTEDSTALLPEIAVAEGTDLRIGKAIIGGSTLKMHSDNLTNGTTPYTFGYTEKGNSSYTTIKNVSLSQAISATDWDIITIQQASDHSATDDYESVYLAPAENLAKYIRENTTAEIVIHETWAYSTYNGLTDGAVPGETEQTEQETMYEALQANYLKLSKDLGNIRIIPVGTAMQLARENANVGDILHRDNNPGHANFFGRLVGAYCYYSVLTGGAATTFDPLNCNYYNAFVKDNTVQWVIDQFSYSISEKYDHGDGNDPYEDTVLMTDEQVRSVVPYLFASADNALALYTDIGFGALATSNSTEEELSMAPTAQMRQASADREQALRFKFTIDTDILKNNIAGYNLVEYGSLAVPEQNVSDEWKPSWFADGDSNIQNGNVKVVIGRAYVAGEKEKLWSVNGNKTVYTAALIKIGYNSNSDTTDYTKWGNSYYVIPYAVYENSKGVQVVKYGRRSAFGYSMFDMINTIISTEESDDMSDADKSKLIADKAYINDVLFEENEALAEAWKNYGGTLDADGNPVIE